MGTSVTPTQHTHANKNTSPSVTPTQRCIHGIDRNSDTQMYPLLLRESSHSYAYTCAPSPSPPTQRCKSIPQHQSPVSAPFGHVPCVELGMKRQTPWLQKVQSRTRSEASSLGCISHHSSLSSGANGTELQVPSLSWESPFKA